MSLNSSLNTSCVFRKKHYKQLLEREHIIKKGIDVESDGCVTGVIEVVKEVKELNRDVEISELIQNSTEMVIDAEVFGIGNEIIGSVVRKWGSSDFCDEDYIQALSELIQNNNNWDAIAKIAVHITKTPKFSACLLGSFDEEVILKVPKQRQVRKQTVLQTEQKPEYLQSQEKQEKGAEKLNLILRQIKKLYNKNHRPLEFYKLITDPLNFMNTVDNAFQISFLARDGRVIVQKDEKGFPLIIPSSKKQIEENMNTNLQAILTLNPLFIKEMISYYKIEKPLLEMST